MRGLSSLERVILECVGNHELDFSQIHSQSGLHENVCFNVLQALLIRGILKAEAGVYKVNSNLSPLILEEINGVEAKKAESLELIEAIVDKNIENVFRFQKVAMTESDERIFLAMVSNLDSFLKDAHKKAQKTTPLKERKVIFWGMGQVESLLKQVIQGR